jgi:hypothetical protein
MVMEIVLIVVGVLVAANVLVAGSIKHQRRPRGAVVKTPRGTEPMTWRDLVRYAWAAIFVLWIVSPFLFLGEW